MTDLDKRRLAFGDQLRELREASGLSGKRLAELAGWPASKVSRVENVKQAVTDSDVRTWCDITETPEAVAAALRDELRGIRLEEATWRRQLRTGHRARQQYSAEIEQHASCIRAFELAVVPGLVQTAEYARHVLTTAAQLQGTEPDTDAAVRVRMERQQVLYMPGKQIDILMAESALRFPVCPRDVLSAQVDRLMALQGLPSVRFGIIPLDTRLPAVPMHGFWIVDDLVLVETVSAEMSISDPDEIAVYHRLADALWTVAATGTAARSLLSHLAAELIVSRTSSG